MKRKIISIFMSACLGFTAFITGPLCCADIAGYAVYAESGDQNEDELSDPADQQDGTPASGGGDILYTWDGRPIQEDPGAAAVPSVQPSANAQLYELLRNTPNIYEKQEGSGKCTLASAVMMLRQKSIIENNATWGNITQKSLAKVGWIGGIGMRHSYTFYGMGVSYQNLNVSDKKQALIDLLEAHPEGLEVYERGLPHAILLTRYVPEEDTFYCADPGLSTEEMKLEDSWLRKISSNADQQDIINAIDAYWYVSSYKYMEIPEYGAAPDPVEPEEPDEPDINDPNYIPDNIDPITGEPIVTDPAVDPITGEPIVDVPTTDVPSDPDIDQPDADNNGDISAGPDKTDSEPKFSRVGSYVSGQFADVVEEEWYIDYIKAVYEMGIMKGMTDSEFGVTKNLTIAQAITMASRIFSTYENDGFQFVQSDDENWFMTYVDYAAKNAIITSEYSGAADYNATATRAQFAEIMGGAISDGELPVINNINDGDIPDVSPDTDQGKAIYRLYRAGILTGDSSGEFMPDANITRAQVAAIMARIADAGLRVKLA
ncbi:MAG: S-layer homology domain-containing protein [Firmicutes bacterium]|nr:S-layer homology domain-containing protein [Bacillota bacterium]